MPAHPAPPEPAKACRRCPRLVALRKETYQKEPDWYNGAVPSFGDEAGELLIVGLAPGLRGAHRTGRTFTGDASGTFLYQALTMQNLTSGTYSADARDDFQLHNVMITNALRCVPPQNKPIADEIRNCQPYLKARIQALPNLKLILTLGRVAHEATLRALALKLKAVPFGHGAEAKTVFNGRSIQLIASYHCSRYNVNTKRLTTKMFDDLLKHVKAMLTSA